MLFCGYVFLFFVLLARGALCAVLTSVITLFVPDLHIVPTAGASQNGILIFDGAADGLTTYIFEEPPESPPLTATVIEGGDIAILVLSLDPSQFFSFSCNIITESTAALCSVSVSNPQEGVFEFVPTTIASISSIPFIFISSSIPTLSSTSTSTSTSSSTSSLTPSPTPTPAPPTPAPQPAPPSQSTQGNGDGGGNGGGENSQSSSSSSSSTTSSSSSPTPTAGPSPTSSNSTQSTTTTSTSTSPLVTPITTTVGGSNGGSAQVVAPPSGGRALVTYVYASFRISILLGVLTLCISLLL